MRRRKKGQLTTLQSFFKDPETLYGRETGESKNGVNNLIIIINTFRYNIHITKMGNMFGSTEPAEPGTVCPVYSVQKTAV